MILVSNREWKIIESCYNNKDIFHGNVHGKDHITAVLEYANKMLEYNICQKDIDVIKWAILFHDSGRQHDGLSDEVHGKFGSRIANDTIAHYKIPVDSRKVSSIVALHAETTTASSIQEAIVRTADRLDLYRFKSIKSLDSTLLETRTIWRMVEPYAIKRRENAVLE